MCVCVCVCVCVREREREGGRESTGGSEAGDRARVKGGSSQGEWFALTGCLYIEKTESDRADPSRERQEQRRKESDLLPKPSLPVNDFLSNTLLKLCGFLSDYKTRNSLSKLR